MVRLSDVGMIVALKVFVIWLLLRFAGVSASGPALETLMALKLKLSS